jgi:hypothetical protein
MTAQREARGVVSEALLKKAQQEATAAVEKMTTLRGASARKVAYAALDAGGDSLRAEHTMRIGIGPGRAWIFAGLAVAAVDLVLYGATAAGKRPRAVRVLAAAAIAGRAGLYAYSQHQQRETRARIRNGLAAGVAGGKP